LTHRKGRTHCTARQTKKLRVEIIATTAARTSGIH
jgi:hypothetical protein